jgi:chaperonin GroES
MTSAAIQFNARAYPAIVSGRDVVKGCVFGDDDGTPVIQMTPAGPQPVMENTPTGPQPKWQIPPNFKHARAERVGEHMSWQLLDEQPEWQDDTDKLLIILPIVGCAFRKSFFEPQLGRNMSLLVTAQNLVINYWAKSMELAPRISEIIKLYPVEIEENKRAGTYVDQDYRSDEGFDDDDAPVEFIEQHRTLDLDEDGYPEPYIVTVHKASNKVARIIARYDADGVHFNTRTRKVRRIDPVPYYTKYDFLPNPEGGIYGAGFGQLLKPINESVNTTLNMMMDAGHRQVVGGGFIGRGLSMHGGAVKFKMGEYRTINATGSAIRDAIVHLESPGPNAVLFQLLGLLIDAGREVAGVKDVLTGENQSANMPATTTLAMIEQGLKVFSGIYKRFYRSLKSEFDKLHRLNRLYLDEQVSYRVSNQQRWVTREDYAKGSGVEPISDPTQVSEQQKLGRAAVLWQLKDDPFIDQLELRRRYLDASAVPDPEKLLTVPPPPPPDPTVALAGRQVGVEESKAMDNRAKVMADIHLAAAKTGSDVQAKRAEEAKNITQAMLNLANAESIVGDDRRGWLEQQLNILQHNFEMAQAEMTAPPMPGARMAPDGNHYVPDPNRPGKYLKLNTDDAPAVQAAPGGMPPSAPAGMGAAMGAPQ